MNKAEEYHFTPILTKIKTICGLPDDSTMARYIFQQCWTELEHVTTIGIDEVNGFATFREDGAFEARPMMIHLCMFKAFLLYYTRKCREMSTILIEDAVIYIFKTQFKYNFGSPE
jgi:hypothetical protein